MHCVTLRAVLLLQQNEVSPIFSAVLKLAFDTFMKNLYFLAESYALGTVLQSSNQLEAYLFEIHFLFLVC